MARLNSRQKRNRKVALALHDLAVSRNPSTQVKVTSAIVAAEMATVRSLSKKGQRITPSSTRPPKEPNYDVPGQLPWKPSKRWGVKK